MGWLECNKIVLTVSDDGVGIGQDKLKTIMEGKGSSSSGSNVAIYNTHKRLQLFYNQNVGLIYRSVEGEGTEVEINIPAHVKNSE